MASLSPRLRPSGRSALLPRCCVRVATCAVVLSSVLGIFAALSAWHALHRSGIYDFEEPPVSSERASQTGEDFEVIRGVNLGGWLVLEPWLAPSLFYQFQGLDKPAIDEKTFCEALGTKEAKRQLEAFRKAWVTEDTFRKLKEIGLNSVRIPYGYWSWGDQSDFCPNISSIHHLDNAVDWAEKHGIRVLLDLHGAKGSQNGFDNSGDSFREPFAASWHNSQAWDATDWTRESNAEITRAVLAKTVGRYRSRPHVTMFGLINEPNGFFTPSCKSGSCPLDQELLIKYHEQAYIQVKEAVGPEMMARASPVLDVSFRPNIWESLHTEENPNWRLAGRWGAMMDSHKYFAFFPFGGFFPQIYYLRTAACSWRSELEWQHKNQLPTMIGEWSLATTDCMTWLNGYGIPAWWNPQSSCDYVPCPQTFGKFPADRHLAGLGDQDAPTGYCPIDPLHAPRGALSFDEFYKRLARYLMRGHERSRGWFFWNFKCEVNDPRWCFMAAWERGWFPKNLSVDAYVPPIPRCDSWDTVFGSYWNSLMVVVFCVVVLLIVVVSLFCTCACVLLTRHGRLYRLRSNARQVQQWFWPKSQIDPVEIHEIHETVGLAATIGQDRG